MSKFSNKCYYGLLAAIELGKHQGKGLVTISEIASRQGIPCRFLEAILRELKQGGIAGSVRGNSGGYFLNSPARDISIGDIVRLLDGEDGGACKTHAANSCEVLDALYQEASCAFIKVLDSTSLEDVLNKERNLESVINYSI